MTVNGRVAGGYTMEKEGMNFGIEEAMVGTNTLYPMLAIRTMTAATVLTISTEEIHGILEELEVVEFPCEEPLEHYQITKDRAIFKRDKYRCSVCMKINPEYQGEHTLLDCPKCHLVV